MSQIINGSQTASLDFQTSTLGSGTLNLASDGERVSSTLSQTTAPAAPTITSPVSGSTDTTTATPTISGGGVSGDTVTVSIDGTVAGTAPVASGAWSFTPTSALEQRQPQRHRDAGRSRRPSSAPSAADTFIVNVQTAPAGADDHQPGQRQHRYDDRHADHFRRRRQRRHGHGVDRWNRRRHGDGRRRRVEFHADVGAEQRQPHASPRRRPRPAGPARPPPPPTRSPSMCRPPLRRRRSPARPTAAPIRPPPSRPFPEPASAATRSRCRSTAPSPVTATVASGALEFHADVALSNASHTITATQAAAGGPSSAAATDTFTVNVGGGGLTISSAVTGPLSLTATNNPLTITSAGSVKATASGADAIDGGSGVAWSINNSGTVASSQRYGISLHGAGSSIVNSGSISGNAGESFYGVDMEAGGTVTNTSAGYITGGEDAIFGAGAALNVNNSGQIVSTFDDGVGLFNGGSVINNAGAVIQAPTGGGFGPAGVYIPSGSANVVNRGSIIGQYGVYLGVAGTVENAGTISGSSSAVTFAVSSSRQSADR